MGAPRYWAEAHKFAGGTNVSLYPMPMLYRRTIRIGLGDHRALVIVLLLAVLTQPGPQPVEPTPCATPTSPPALQSPPREVRMKCGTRIEQERGAAVAQLE